MASEESSGGQKKVDKADSEGDTEENSLGIPKAEFLDDVGKFMERQENTNNATKVIRKLDEDHNKYRFMEINLTQKKFRYKKQIPEIKETLSIIGLIKKRNEEAASMKTNFLLSNQVYMEAEIKPSDKVCLWLGANVMLEYPLDEAKSLLQKNLQTAIKMAAQVDKDLIFLRDQMTTTEVNMARIYNWDVKRRQSQSQTS